MNKILKIALVLFHLLGFQYSYAAPTDCIQMASDGQINCTKAKSVFTRGGNSTKFDTLDELIQNITQILCSSPLATEPGTECYLQLEGSPTYPPPGRDKCGNGPCNKYTTIDYNTSVNRSIFVAVTILRNSDPYYLDKHSQYTSYAYHQRLCPLNTTAVVSEINEETPYIVYCKPKSEIKQNPTSCSSSCNVNTGSSTISN